MPRRITFFLLLFLLFVSLSGISRTSGAEEEASDTARRVTLRSKGKAVSPGDVGSILRTHGFFAACWNYNADFCNPAGDFENAFVDNRDGTVTDRSTGLMWQKGGFPEGMTWLEAKAFVEQVNREGWAGHADWRLPTIEEIASLLETCWTACELFIAPVFEGFPKNCWSVDTQGMYAAWKANFKLGIIMDVPQTAKNGVRLVRSLP